MIANVQLSQAQLEELMRRYYAGEKVQALIDEFELPIHACQLTELFPGEVLEDTLCAYCRIPMVRRAISRSALQSRTSPATPQCPACQHFNVDSCTCKQCTAKQQHLARLEAEQQQLRQQNQERDRRKIVRSWVKPVRDVPTSPTSMSLADAVYLCALARGGLCEDDDLIRSLHTFTIPLAPGESSDVAMRLYSLDLIDIDPDSPLSAFSFQDDPLTCYPSALEWRLRLGAGHMENRSILRNLELLLRDRASWPADWEDELLGVWRELALHECIDYFKLKLGDHGLPFNPGDKTRMMIMTLLERFSIAQMYNLIWCAAKEAAAFYLRTGVPRPHAANYAIGGCERRAERALVEGWSIKGFRRDYRCPESISASLFANVVSGLGERYLTSVPTQGTLLRGETVEMDDSCESELSDCDPGAAAI